MPKHFEYQKKIEVEFTVFNSVPIHRGETFRVDCIKESYCSSQSPQEVVCNWTNSKNMIKRFSVDSIRIQDATKRAPIVNIIPNMDGDSTDK
jgi:hypothetical protein